jgi:1-acyl-sn-glycerol-3-phosphate acyltransferase
MSKHIEMWYNFAIFITQSYRRLFIKHLHVTGQDNMFPGPKIIVANHSLASDVFIIPAIFKDRLHFLVEEDLLTLPFFGKLLALADQIPVYAGRGQEALATAYDRLKIGHSIVIFPEGKLSHGKEVQRARSGAVHLALTSGYPLVPVGIYTPTAYARSFTSSLFGRESEGHWQMGGNSFVTIGNAWELTKETFEKTGYRALREATDDLRGRLENLVQRAYELAERLGIPPELLD